MRRLVTRKIANSFIKLYQKHGLSTHEIGKKLGFDDETVREHLKKSGVRLRTKSEANILRYKRNPTISKNELKRLYYKEKLTQKEIAEKIGCHVTCIQSYMKKYGLKTRDRSKSYMLFLKSDKGKKRIKKEIERRIKKRDLVIKEKTYKWLNENPYSLGYIIGSVCGDGCISKHRYTRRDHIRKDGSVYEAKRMSRIIRLSVKDKDFIEEFVKHYTKITGRKRKIRKGFRNNFKSSSINIPKDYELIFYDIVIKDVSLWFIIKSVKDTNFKWIGNKPKELKLGFITGMYDAEGYVGKNLIVFASSNMFLHNIMRATLNEFNIESSIYHPKSQLYPTLVINKKASKRRFAELVKLSIGRKQEALRNFL